jgi:apolipoprotein N-acyltransferase
MKISTLLALLLSLLSGLLVSLAFPPWKFEWLIWVGLTPILAALLLFELDWRFSLLCGALFGGFFGGTTFFWLLQSGREVDWIWNVGTLTLIGIIWAYLVNRFVDLRIKGSVGKEKVSPIFPGQGSTPEAWHKSLAHLRAALFVAATWTVLEWARGVLIPAWNTFGSSLQTSLPLLQLATVTGASGLTFIIVFANLIVLASVRRLIVEPGRMSWASRFDVTSTLGGIFLIAAGGFYFLQPHGANNPKTIGLVSAHSTDVGDLIAKTKLNQPVDLWIWGAAKIEPGDYSKFAEASIGKESGLVAGVTAGDQNSVNGVVVLTPGSVKNIFVVPRSYPLFQPYAGSQGRTLNSFEYKDATWVPLLNWESGDLLFVRGAVAKGIQILVSIADLPHAPRTAAEQLLSNVRFLALSLGRPVIFASPEFAVVATKSGKIVARSDANGDAVAGQLEAPQTFDVTFYGRYGDWFAIACGAITIVTAISQRLRKKGAVS